jgi:hypothetical protein
MERPARFLPGLRMLVLGIVVLLAGVVLVVQASHDQGSIKAVVILIGVLCFIAVSLMLRGLTAVTPGQARVVQLFGKYRGTIRESGLQWVNPFTDRIKVSTRIRNQESAQAKVNDADGNPIEIAAVVVWQVRDTANAVYSVDDFTQFVTIQTETAVRHIASTYPYDNRGSDRISLRDNADEITRQLSAELTVRVRSAVLRPGDRPGHAAPAAGQRGRRRPAAHSRGRRRHGPAGAAAPGSRGRRRAGRGAESQHGV